MFDRICSLSSALAPTPTHALRRGALLKGSWQVEIRDLKTRQVLIVSHDEPLAAYWFVDSEKGETAAADGVGLLNWGPEERRPDGLLIGAMAGQDWACFVELKSSLEHKDPKKAVPAEHALDQVASAAKHFHPAAGSHGRAHHDRWADGSDPLEVVPHKDHRVVGLVVALRRVPRPPPRRALELGETKVPLRTVQLPMSERNCGQTTFTELLRHAGVLE